MNKAKTFRYETDGKVLTEFFWDRSRVSIIQGPIESGTSTASIMKMWRLSEEQKPDAQGFRRTRWYIIRNTYNDLKGTTLKTWQYWFEEKAMGAYGEVRMTNPPDHRVKRALRDGTTVDSEFVFLALDQEEDIRKLVSSEATGFFFNEAQYTEKGIFDTALSRTGRFPPKLDGGPTWHGIVADLNAPPEGHWIPYMRGDVPLPDEWDDDSRREYRKPKAWTFFVQPPGLIEKIENGRVVGYEPNPLAENQKWQTVPYIQKIDAKQKSWIDTYVMNRVGIYRQGRAVFESFRPEVHVSKEKLVYQPEWPLIVGLDFARNPAAMVCQLIRGAMYVLDEFGMENVSAGTFAPMLRQRLVRKFPAAFVKDGNGAQYWGDPTGASKGQATDKTPFSIFLANGMSVTAAPGNNMRSIRFEAVQGILDKMIDGAPALQSDQSCRVFNAGMAGAYHFAKIQGQKRYHEEPYKDRYSDYCDAFQYACLGAGLGFAVMNPGKEKPKPQKVLRSRYSIQRRSRR